MSWCYDVRGPSYHWVIDLFEGLNLPVIPAVVEALQKEVAERMKEVQRGKTDHKKKVRIQMKVARAEEQEARKKWVKRQAIQHTYGQEEELGEDDEAEDPALIEAAREALGSSGEHWRHCAHQWTKLSLWLKTTQANETLFLSTQPQK